MAAISIATFIAQAALSSKNEFDDAAALSAIARGSSLAAKLTGRVFGHVVEAVTANSPNYTLTIYRHGQTASGQCYISDRGIVGLQGVVNFTVVDPDNINVTGVTMVSTMPEHRVCFLRTADLPQRGGKIRVYPGPVAAMDSLYRRSSYPGIDPYGKAIDATEYWLPEGENLRCELMLEPSVSCSRRVRASGMVGTYQSQPIRDFRLKYYAGFLDMPEDLASAIAEMSVEMTKPESKFAKEEYEDYSYEMMTAAELALVPTSARAILNMYKASQ